MGDRAKRRVAVLGGGMASLSAAYALSEPERRGRYDVTVYTLGFRLGGKGASARNPARHNRIEEHGLHLWMGCYENAFRVMRACYRELGRPPGAPLAKWTDAFAPHNFTVLQDRFNDAWHPWPQKFPILPTVPGDGDGVGSPVDLVRAMLRWLKNTVRDRNDETRCTPPPTAFEGQLGTSILDPLVDRFDAAGDGAVAHLREAIDAMTHGLLDGSSQGTPLVHRALAFSLDKVRDLAWSLFAGRAVHDLSTRRAMLTFDFVATNIVGILNEGFLVPPSGCVGDLTFGQWLENVRRIDHLDYRTWLAQHGAHPETVNSTIVRGLGDAVFNSNHDGAAGTALNGLVRLNLTYRGSLFYKMQAGMGEVVFTPLYQVLRRRGVRFEFFHRVEDLELDAAQENVVAVHMAKQAEVKNGDYQPLIDVPVPGGNLPCWPPGPDWDQLRDGAQLAATGLDLESPAPIPGETKIRMTDFDDVVLGISIAGLPAITSQLSAKSEAWRAMLRNIKTTRTQALQLWFDKSLAELGWEGDAAIVTGYAEALDTWADMSHLAKVEGDPDVKNIAYFCGSIDDDGKDEDQLARVRASSLSWLRENLGHLLPNAVNSGDVAWERLVDDRGRIGSARLDAQYVRANVYPSERYVLSVPGSSRYRLKSNESGFGRLYLAGDWVRTGMNVGSIEATVMAGLQAAKAISGDDILIVGDVD